jgi:uncharacterized protein YwgA
MSRYQLAKIVEWAETFRSRKRMQKLIFSLQAAGCSLEANYDLHYYGPYSHDVATLTDEMVREGLLKERSDTYHFGGEYSYTLPETSRQHVSNYEAGLEGSQMAQQMGRFQSLARKLHLAAQRARHCSNHRVPSEARQRLARCRGENVPVQEFALGHRIPEKSRGVGESSGRARYATRISADRLANS